MLDIVAFHLHNLDVRGPLWCWRKQCCCCHDNGSIAFTLTHAVCFQRQTSTGLRLPVLWWRARPRWSHLSGASDPNQWQQAKIKTAHSVWRQLTGWYKLSGDVWVTAARLSRRNAPYKEATNCCQLTTTSTEAATVTSRSQTAAAAASFPCVWTLVNSYLASTRNQLPSLASLEGAPGGRSALVQAGSAMTPERDNTNVPLLV